MTATTAAVVFIAVVLIVWAVVLWKVRQADKAMQEMRHYEARRDAFQRAQRDLKRPRIVATGYEPKVRQHKR